MNFLVAHILRRHNHSHLLVSLAIARGRQCRCQMILYYLIGTAVLLVYNQVQFVIFDVVIVPLGCQVGSQSLLPRIGGVPLRVIQRVQ